MRLAEARRRASVITINSIRFSFAGMHVGWTMNTSLPRTLSKISTMTSPSLKDSTLALPRGTLRKRATSDDSWGFALPVNTIMLLSAVRCCS